MTKTVVRRVGVRNLGRALVVALTAVVVWLILACGDVSEERLLREHARCLVDSNSALHRMEMANRTGMVPLSVEGAERWLRRQLDLGEITMDEIRAMHTRHC